MGASGDYVETPTLDENFSSDNWVDNDSAKIGVSSNVLSATFVADSTNDSSVYDLGVGVSDTEWVLRFKQNASDYSGTTIRYWIGLSDSSQTASGGTSGTAQEFIGFFGIGNNSGNGGTADYDGAVLNSGAWDTNSAYTLSTSTDYYWEITRTSATTYYVKIYSDSGYTTLLKTWNGTCPSTIDNLRYIVLRNENDTRSGTVAMTIDDMKFWNGVSSLTSKPTNVQSGSRFEETDTRKIYYLDSSYPVSSDSLGTAVDGTATGITKTNTGKIGSNCWSFANSYVDSGNPDYVSVSNTLEDSWYSAGELTINFWVYRHNTNSALPITVYDDGTNRGIEFSLNTSSGISVTNLGGNVLQSATNAVPANVWKMITLTIDVDKNTQTDVKAKLWIDGSSVDTDDTFQFYSRSSDVYIGTLSHPNGKGYGLNGKLDDLSFWNRPLTSAEIGYLYNSGTGRSIPQAITDNNLSTSGLLAYYDFEETSGNLINKAVTSTVWNEEA